jgi:hypothetical protein
VFAHINDVFTVFGFPWSYKTDNGKEYANDLIEQFAKAGNATHGVTIAYNHHANGKVERANRTVHDTIVKKALATTGDSNNWDRFVPIVMLKLNNKIQCTTNSSSFALMFGHQPFWQGEGASGQMSQDQAH